MIEKVFEGQYNDEKILLRTHPHWFQYFLEKLPTFLIYIVIATITIMVGIFSKSQFLFVYILVAICILSCFGIYFKWMHKHARYTITSRRCIFFVRKNIIKRSYKEIHLVDMRLTIPKKTGFFGMIFGYGNLKIVDKDENFLLYTGIREHKYLARYLGRIIDYIKINGHTDNFSAYQPRKIRMKMKKEDTIKD